MNTKDLERIMAMIENTDISEIEYQNKDDRIKIKRHISETQKNQNIVFQPAHPMQQHTILQHPPMAQDNEKSQNINENKKTAAEKNLVEVTSPFVGTFYRAPAPDADPFVKEGDRVKRGDTLCIVEAMKLMNEIEAETDGVVREILVKNATPVEYGEILFHIERI